MLIGDAGAGSSLQLTYEKDYAKAWSFIHWISTDLPHVYKSMRQIHAFGGDEASMDVAVGTLMRVGKERLASARNAAQRLATWCRARGSGGCPRAPLSTPLTSLQTREYILHVQMQARSSQEAAGAECKDTALGSRGLTCKPSRALREPS